MLADRDALSEGIEQMNEATPSNAVIWRVDERGVAYITLNRPQVYNAYNGDLIAALLINSPANLCVRP